MIRVSIKIILALSVSLLISSCGGGSDPIVPTVTFPAVGSYGEIPADFDFIYEITDNDANPPFRMVLVFERSGQLSYYLYEVTPTGTDESEEHATISEDEVLDLYNYIVQQNFFNYDGLYTVLTPIIPVRVLLVHAKNLDIRTEHHTCPDAPNPAALPSGFNNIINYITDLASGYLDSI